MNEACVWWEATPGPHQMVRHVADALLDRKGIWLTVKMLPWSEAFRESVRERVYDCDSSTSFNLLDASAYPPDSDLQEVVFRYIRRPEKPFYPSQGLAEYLTETTSTSDTIIWVYNLSGQLLGAFCSLAADLALRRASIIIACELPGMRSPRKNVEQVTAERFISSFDILHFVMSMVSSATQNRKCSEYLSVLIAEMVGFGIDRCLTLCSRIDDLMADPASCYSVLFPGENPGIIQNAIWNAQIKILFPQIEKQRLALIDRMGKVLDVLLPFSDEWGNRFSRREEIELRHIQHFLSNGRITLLPQDRRRFENLYDMRNDLAHLTIIKPERVIAFLEGE